MDKPIKKTYVNKKNYIYYRETLVEFIDYCEDSRKTMMLLMLIWLMLVTIFILITRKIIFGFLLFFLIYFIIKYNKYSMHLTEAVKELNQLDLKYEFKENE